MEAPREQSPQRHSFPIGEDHLDARSVELLEQLGQPRAVASQPIGGRGDDGIDVATRDGSTESAEGGSVQTQPAHPRIAIDLLGRYQPAARA